MSALITKHKGVFFIRVRKTLWNVWYQYYEKGKRYQEKVELLAYPEIGFRPDMSAEEAKARCKQLNTERRIEKDNIRKAASRVVELKVLDETLFPKDQVGTFIEKLEEENFGSDEHLKKTISAFNFIQKMVIDLKLTDPGKYHEDSKRIYKHFLKKKVSVNYANRLIALLNRWGRFVARIRGSYFEDVNPPKGRERSAIAEAQQSKTGVNSERGVRIKSDPLTPEILETMKSKVSIEHYNWLYLTVWLGLRPEEADGLKDPKSYKVNVTDDGVAVLSVYQPKLMSIPEHERWKHIPLIFKEQLRVLEIIESGEFLKPLAKTIRKHSGSDRINQYGGRKNFVDLCLDRDQNFVDISAWLGHKDTSITFGVYKQRQLVRYTKVDSEKPKKKGFKIV